MSNGKIDRRTAMLWAASVAATFNRGIGAFAMAPTPIKLIATSSGYGLDPSINEGKAPWPRTLTGDQLRQVIALCDFILPAGDGAPAASEIGVQEMIDEWVSAPYPDQVADRALILQGLEWLDVAAASVGAARFNDATDAQRTLVLTRLATLTANTSPTAPDGFYRKVRKLIIGGYYTTPEGFKDIGYIGNVPLAAYPGPSAEVLAALEGIYQRLGLKA